MLPIFFFEKEKHLPELHIILWAVDIQFYSTTFPGILYRKQSPYQCLPGEGYIQLFCHNFVSGSKR